MNVREISKGCTTQLGSAGTGTHRIVDVLQPVEKNLSSLAEEPWIARKGVTKQNFGYLESLSRDTKRSITLMTRVLIRDRGLKSLLNLL